MHYHTEIALKHAYRAACANFNSAVPTAIPVTTRIVIMVQATRPKWVQEELEKHMKKHANSTTATYNEHLIRETP